MPSLIRALVMLACLPLHGCLFFFVAPVPAATAGNICVAAGSQSGQVMKHRDTGQTFKLVRVYGVSKRCPEGTWLGEAEYSYQ